MTRHCGAIDACQGCALGASAQRAKSGGSHDGSTKPSLRPRRNQATASASEWSSIFAKAANVNPQAPPPPGKLNRYLSAHLIVGGRRDADASGFRDTLKPRSDVDPDPENVGLRIPLIAKKPLWESYSIDPQQRQQDARVTRKSTTVSGGNLVVAGNEVIPNTSVVSVGAGTGKQFTVLAGFTETIASISTTGVLNLDGTLIVGGNNLDFTLGGGFDGAQRPPGSYLKRNCFINTDCVAFFACAKSRRSAWRPLSY